MPDLVKTNTYPGRLNCPLAPTAIVSPAAFILISPSVPKLTALVGPECPFPAA